MLTLPEFVLLFALHDEKGTVHPAAFLAIDHALRGATLAELRLQGKLQTRIDGGVRRHPDRWGPMGWPVLDEVLAALGSADDPGTVGAWLTHLQYRVPRLRRDYAELLERRGILATADKDRVLLPGQVNHPMRDGSAEAAMLDRLVAVARGTEQVSPRVGTLLALVVASHLTEVLFEAVDRDAARVKADWVAERDSVVVGVREAIARTEGTW